MLQFFRGFLLIRRPQRSSARNPFPLLIGRVGSGFQFLTRSCKNINHPSDVLDKGLRSVQEELLKQPRSCVKLAHFLPFVFSVRGPCQRQIVG